MEQTPPEQIDVSILVPAYNEEDTLAQVIERLLALSISKEIIVIDDCSTDRTGEIAESFGDKHRLPAPSPK
ncbi:MAG: glycosyltransferase [Armatimonadetes bacterium]|nr:glycosyltransferase [Armatimonadota bacterium]